MLNIEEFSEKPSKDKEEKGQESIQDIRSYYEKLIEKIIQEKYNEGFKDGFEKGQQEAEKKLKEEFEKKHKELLDIIERLKAECEIEKKAIVQDYIEKIETNLKNEIDKIKIKIADILIDSLEDILCVLYISPKNVDFLKKKILEIINSFEEEKVLKVIVNEKLLPYFKDFPFKVEAGDVKEGDFTIKFKNFSIESKFREKMATIKNEFKREIKNTT